MDDTVLTELLYSGNESGLEAVQKEYSGYLTTAIRRFLRSPEDCEECLSDTMLAAWNSIPPNRPSDLRTYLLKLARRIAIDRLRKNNADMRRAEVLPVDELEECLPSPDDAQRQAEQKELRQALSDFLSSLDTESRNMFVLRYWYSYNLEELSGVCGKSRNALAVELFRIRSSLKKYLTEKELY